MERDQMLSLFEAHREAEAARDIDGILKTFVPDPFLETNALGLRSEGRDAVRAAYEMQFFSAFPDLAPADEGMAFGDDTVVVWGTLHGTSLGDWLGVPAGGGTFAVPFANVVPFRDGLMAGEIIYFDLATLCEQGGIPLRRFGQPRQREGPEGGLGLVRQTLKLATRPRADSRATPYRYGVRSRTRRLVSLPQLS